MSDLRDLNACIPGAMNFKYGDFVRSDTAIRLNIPNIPTENQWQSIEYVATQILQPIRDEFGLIRVTSGFRSVPLCLAVGSNSKSWHSHGCAVDLDPCSSKVRLITILEFIHLHLSCHELIAEYFPYGWVHVASGKGIAPTKKIKLKDKDHNYSFETLDYIKDLYA